MSLDLLYLLYLLTVLVVAIVAGFGWHVGAWLAGRLLP